MYIHIYVYLHIYSPDLLLSNERAHSVHQRVLGEETCSDLLRRANPQYIVYNSYIKPIYLGADLLFSNQRAHTVDECVLGEEGGSDLLRDAAGLAVL